MQHPNAEEDFGLPRAELSPRTFTTVADIPWLADDGATIEHHETIEMLYGDDRMPVRVVRAERREPIRRCSRRDKVACAYAFDNWTTVIAVPWEDRRYVLGDAIVRYACPSGSPKQLTVFVAKTDGDYIVEVALCKEKDAIFKGSYKIKSSWAIPTHLFSILNSCLPGEIDLVQSSLHFEVEVDPATKIKYVKVKPFKTMKRQKGRQARVDHGRIDYSRYAVAVNGPVVEAMLECMLRTLTAVIIKPVDKNASSYTSQYYDYRVFLRDLDEFVNAVLFIGVVESRRKNYDM